MLILFRAVWSIDHVDTNTHCDMSASLVSKNQQTVGDLVLSYSENGVENIAALKINGKLDVDNRQFVLSVSKGTLVFC